MKEYKITRDKFFDTKERAAILKLSEDLALADKAKGRITWQVRWMLVHLALFSGLRVSEIAALKIGDVNLDNGDPYIFVRNGKGGRSRDVYIDRELTRHLKQFIRDKKSWSEPTDKESPLFAGRGGQHFTTTALTISFKKAILKAGLRTNLSIHSARHTYATFLYAKTENMRYTQKQLGHASLNMTALYADILPEQNRSLANKILD